MKQIALSEIKDDLSKYLRLAEDDEIIITRHGKPAGVLVGFASEDDWFDYKLEHDGRKKGPSLALRLGWCVRVSSTAARLTFVRNRTRSMLARHDLEAVAGD